MNTRIKPIKSSSDYDEALKLAEELISIDPSPDTEEHDRLSILTILISDYEKKHFPIDIPSAIDAIKFRMEQLNLKPSDLSPYLGSASRVSEILSGKRFLTVDMINSLSSNLNIPEKALLKREDDNEYSRNIPSSTFKQMKKRGYFDERSDSKSVTLQKFFSKSLLQPAAFYRKSQFRTNPNTNHYALIAWASHVLEKAKEISPKKAYQDGTITLSYLQQLAKLSADEENGPKRAIMNLQNDGITVIIEPALDGAKVDGITILEDKQHPIIGLSLRYDRLDNFWFTLMHELAHISLHYNLGDFIYDDLDLKNDHLSKIENEADNLASESLIDTAKWLVSPARNIPSPITAAALANELGVHIAIIAGKARHETGNWKYLSKTVNNFTIRDKFKEVIW